MGEIWYEIDITTKREAWELIVSFMSDIGCQGFLEGDESIKCYIKKESWNKHKEMEMTRFLNKLKEKNLIFDYSISINEIVETNWNELWESTIEPVEVSEKIIIKPTWREYGNREDKIIIEIDPKMAFGTGYHETTRLVLRALEKYIFPGCKMLDIGTGTGILAIASIKLGASKAIGIDTDEWSYQNAIENAIINNVADKFSAILGTIDNVDEDEFDIIAANINRNTILEILDKISTKLKSRGIFILSGILTSDKRMTEERLKLDGFELLEILSENEWIAMVSRK